VADKPELGVVIVSVGETVNETALDVVDAVVPFNELVTTTE
jgi:hypothetical protein